MVSASLSFFMGPKGLIKAATCLQRPEIALPKVSRFHCVWKDNTWGHTLYFTGHTHLIDAVLSDSINVQHMPPHCTPDGVRDSLVHPSTELVRALVLVPIHDHLSPLQGPLPLDLYHLLRDEHVWEGPRAGGGEEWMIRVGRSCDSVRSCDITVVIQRYCVCLAGILA